MSFLQFQEFFSATLERRALYRFSNMTARLFQQLFVQFAKTLFSVVVNESSIHSITLAVDQDFYYNQTIY